jgi:hypothetical protein
VHKAVFGKNDPFREDRGMWLCTEHLGVGVFRRKEPNKGINNRFDHFSCDSSDIDSFYHYTKLVKKAKELFCDQFAILLYITNSLATHRVRPSFVTSN